MLSSLASLFLARPGNNRGMRREIDEKRKARDRWRLLFLFSFFFFFGRWRKIENKAKKTYGGSGRAQETEGWFA